MGGRKKSKAQAAPEPVRPNINRTIIQAVTDLLLEYAGDIAAAQAGTKDNIIRIGFSANIDCSGAQPTIKVGIRIPNVVIKGSRTAVLDDENQGGFQFLAEVDGNLGDDDGGMVNDDDADAEESGEVEVAAE